MADEREYERGLVAMHPVFQEVYRGLAEEWAPGRPPATLVMAAMGRALSSRVDEFAVIELGAIFASIDMSLASGSEQVKNAVATGFLESLLAYADLHPEFLRLVGPMMGPEALRYCDAWNRITGAKQ